MASTGPWARSAAVGRRSTPAFLMASAVVVAMGWFIVDWAEIRLPAAELAPAVVPLALAGAAVLVARSAARQVWPSRPARQPAAPPPPESPEEARDTIEMLCAAGPPDATALVDYLLRLAETEGASDVHFVPYEGFVDVRFRVDGILQDVAQLPGRAGVVVANRLKVLSRLVTFVHDRPQDGRFELPGAQRSLDVRSAFMPTLHGERVVLRLVRAPGAGMALDGLGFTAEQHDLFRRLLQRPQGLIILTGPAGAGKTTTIYAALAAILDESAGTRSIYTLENPVEHDLLRINQTQIEEARGFSFADGLRSLLRQDPDVIMVGEIRDAETARIALQAGMTGHLIITTVHAGSAAGAFARLIELGIDTHSVASAVTACVGQRLVRLLCPHCKRLEPPAPWLQSAAAGGTFYGPVGCPRCEMKGYRGRRALFEILESDDTLGRMVVGRAAPDQIRAEAARRGLKSLHQAGLELARRGETSLGEALRVAPPESGEAQERCPREA